MTESKNKKQTNWNENTFDVSRMMKTQLHLFILSQRDCVKRKFPIGVTANDE